VYERQNASQRYDPSSARVAGLSPMSFGAAVTEFEVGDRAFHSLGAALHAQPPRVREGKLPLGGRPRFEAVTVTEKDAREALLYVLFSLHGRTSAARLNTRLVQQAIVEAELEIAPGRLLMVPFERSGEDLLIPGTGQVMPGLLLAGRPELEAMRATVWLPGAGPG
jgi:hypothetical protein